MTKSKYETGDRLGDWVIVLVQPSPKLNWIYKLKHAHNNSLLILDQDQLTRLMRSSAD